MSELLSIMRSGRKPVIGMVQLSALPGGSRYSRGSIDDVLDVALDEARILTENGVDALMLQNLGDIPVALHATTPQVAWMTRIATELRSHCKAPLGLNLLENDAQAMMAIASAAGADFVRIKIFVGAMMTPFGLETGKAHEAIKARVQWNAEKVAIFADVHDRTGTPLASSGFDEDVEFAIRLGGADGLVLTGKTYEKTLRLVKTAKSAYPGIPVLVGGGVTAENFSEIASIADGAIVSTSLKGSGSAVGRFVPERVQSFMEAARRASTAN